jgi:protein-L-isoaspartate(D-aspartate) O-methyltransferase
MKGTELDATSKESTLAGTGHAPRVRRRSRRPWVAGAALLLAAAIVLAVFAQARIKVEPYLLDDDFARERHAMVDRHLEGAIEDEIVLKAMRDVPRHHFVPRELWPHAYENRPLPIGWDQTISQPFIVALMTELLGLTPKSKVLEVGTGSGYQAAVLAEVAGEVYSIEIVEELAAWGALNLKEAGYEAVHLRVGDGYQGWPEAAPFDAIIVTCAPDHIPLPLEEQLAEGGRLVIPVGEEGRQELVLVVKENGSLVRREVIPVRFVPMTGPGAEGRQKTDEERSGDEKAPQAVEAEGLN